MPVYVDSSPAVGKSIDGPAGGKIEVHEPVETGMGPGGSVDEYTHGSQNASSAPQSGTSRKRRMRRNKNKTVSRSRTGKRVKRRKNKNTKKHRRRRMKKSHKQRGKGYSALESPVNHDEVGSGPRGGEARAPIVQKPDCGTSPNF